jgi:hypothetical protein
MSDTIPNRIHGHNLGSEKCWREATYGIIWTYPGCLFVSYSQDKSNINLFDLYKSNELMFDLS